MSVLQQKRRLKQYIKKQFIVPISWNYFCKSLLKPQNVPFTPLSTHGSVLFSMMSVKLTLKKQGSVVFWFLLYFQKDRAREKQKETTLCERAEGASWLDLKKKRNFQFVPIRRCWRKTASKSPVRLNEADNWHTPPHVSEKHTLRKTPRERVAGKLHLSLKYSLTGKRPMLHIHSTRPFTP